MLLKRVSRRVVPALVAAGGLACGSGLGPEFAVEPRLDQELVLRVGQTVVIEGADGLRLKFEEVSTDSRCPSDALILCVWEGDAAATVRAKQDPLPPVDLELHTSAQFDTVATYGAFQVTRVRLDPYPKTTDPIPGAEYRLTVVVSRKEQ